jgi:hypothetical protein
LPAALILLCTLFPSRELEREALKYGVRHVISKAEMTKALGGVFEMLRQNSKQVS